MFSTARVEFTAVLYARNKNAGLISIIILTGNAKLMT